MRIIDEDDLRREAEVSFDATFSDHAFHTQLVVARYWCGPESVRDLTQRWLAYDPFPAEDV